MRLYKKNKRPFLMLEVLIAFALIAMCALPLIAPHAVMLKEQREFLRKVELDHLVNLLYANVLEKLYLNRLNWNDILEGSFEVTPDMLQETGYDKPLYYIGSFNFNEEKPIRKPKKQESYSHYFFKLTFNFLPIASQGGSAKDKTENTLKYTYNVFIVRDLGSGNQAPPSPAPPSPAPSSSAKPQKGAAIGKILECGDLPPLCKIPNRQGQNSLENCFTEYAEKT